MQIDNTQLREYITQLYPSPAFTDDMVMMLPPRPGCCSFCATICLAAALEHATAHNTCCGKPQWLHGTLKVAMVNQTEGEQQCQEQHAESINQLVPARTLAVHCCCACCTPICVAPGSTGTLPSG